MSWLQRLVNVAWFRARRAVEGEPDDGRAAAMDEEVPALTPAPSPPAEAPPVAEAPRAPRPRRL